VASAANCVVAERYIRYTYDRGMWPGHWLINTVQYSTFSRFSVISMEMVMVRKHCLLLDVFFERRPLLELAKRNMRISF
jgi:hypothetical protein